MKRFLSFVVASLTGVASFAQVAPSIGSGSQEDPFKISSAEELLWLSKYVDSIAETKSVHAELIADIDMSSVCGEGKGSWKSIGKPKARFMGSFEGNNHSISNLYVNATDTYNGLFGVARSAHISNLTIESGNIKSTTYSLGAIVGNAGNYTIIENCHNYASVTSKRFAGGIAGFMGVGTVIKRCHNEGTISSGNDWGCGGIVGGSDDGLVTNCYNLGTVTGESRVAGILGDFQGPSAITNCFSFGEVKCGKLSGPVVGYTAESSSAAVLKNNYFCTVDSTNKKAKYATMAQFKSGEIAYLLNAGQDTLAWYQTIGQDSHPVFDTTHLVVSYDSVSLKYYNNIDTVIPEIPVEEEIGFGDGTIDNPFRIRNAEELLWFSNYVDSIAETKNVYAELIADIDMSSVCGKEKGTWKSIGKPKRNFTGSFEGNGHTISNLYMSVKDGYNGLFGQTKNARISNLTIASGVLTSSTYPLGAIVGSAVNTVIENCHNYASVTSNRFAGGIAGFMGQGTVIKQCHNEGSISSGNDWGCGGIVGGSNAGLVTNCYNLGSVTGESRVAGILGDFQGTSAITNSYSLGYVKCGKLSGPVVGYTAESSSSAVLKNNYYNTSDSTNKKATYASFEKFMSGEIAYLLNAGQDTLVWYQTVGQDSFPVFDTTHLVVFLDTVNLTYFNKIDTIVTDTVIPEEEKGFGDGTIDNPFRISNAEELLWLSNYVDSIAETKSVYAELIADIDMSSVCGADKGSWKPIGKPKACFMGSFEGNNHSISNLYVNATDTYNGLFGVARSAHISNLTIESGNIKSTTYSLGAIVGSAVNTVIENCHNYASVTSNRFAGGIAGFMSQGTVIKQCHNEGSISSGNDWGCGGIVGGSNDGLVTNCYNLGTVTGESRVAGILGDFQGPSAITNCFNLGEVKCGKLSGPVVGYTAESSSAAVLKNNYYNTSDSTNKKAQYATLDQFKSGEIAYLLNAGQDTLVWFQTVNEDEYPVFDPSRGVVKHDSVNNVYTGIDEILANVAANVYVADRTVYVKEAKSLKIFNILGVNVTNLNGKLINGIYAVQADDKTYKVVVK